MLDQFYVGRGTRRFGPFSAAQLKDYADSGRLRGTDTVWREGMKKPVLASRVKKLFPDPEPQTSLAPVNTLAAKVSDLRSTHLDRPPLAAVEQASVPAPLPAQAPAATSPPQQPVRVLKKYAVAQQGVVVISQDGTTVYYRKKCTECGHEDTARSCMVIVNGISRSHFFCPKCRKSREVLMQGQMR